MASVDLGAGRHPAAIAAGRWHTCALLDNDDVKVRGYTRLACLPPPHVFARNVRVGPRGQCEILSVTYHHL